jgi:hypothetical protein
MNFDSLVINDVVLIYSSVCFHSSQGIMGFSYEVQENLSHDVLLFEGVISIIHSIVVIIPNTNDV